MSGVFRLLREGEPPTCESPLRGWERVSEAGFLGERLAVHSGPGPNAAEGLSAVLCDPQTLALFGPASLIEQALPDPGLAGPAGAFGPERVAGGGVAALRPGDRIAWLSDYSAYASPRGPREGTARTVYHGAAHWRIGGRRVAALLQRLPAGERTLPHYHGTPELFVCLEGAFTVALVPKEGGAARRREVAAGGLLCAGPGELHPVLGSVQGGAWNLVCCVRSRARGDGALRNHYWKDVPREVYSGALDALGRGRPSSITGTTGTTGRPAQGGSR